MSVTYSLATRLAAARAILAAKTYDHQRAALDHWHVFMDTRLPCCFANDGRNEVEYTEDMFSTLRQEATTWYLTHLETRIEELEAPNGGRLGFNR